MFEESQEICFVIQEGGYKRWTPFEDFGTECEDQESKSSMNKTKKCKLTEIDEREEYCISTKVWGTSFTIRKHSSNDIVLLYNHPVYSRVRDNYNHGRELIMYV